MGHVPIRLVAGDFLQIKPAKEISIADDLDALRQAGKAVHPEHHTAQDASLGIAGVIHLTKSKRCLDEAMPALMQALRTRRPDAPLAVEELQKLRRINIENCKQVHQTPLFADGHVVNIYWENISRSIVERTHRDANTLAVPLFCLQAADRRASYKNKNTTSLLHLVC